MGEAKLSAKKQAEEIQSTLDPMIPSLIIVMLKSQVGGGFWLGVPTEFARPFMSKHKIVMTLEDQEGKNYKVNYIPPKGLSGGWKKFVVDHKLRMGDAVLFQLVDLMKFKVFIFKGNGVPDTDGEADIDDGLTLLQLKARAQRRTQGDASKNLKRGRKPVAKRQSVESEAGGKSCSETQRRVRSAVIRDENGSQQQPDDNVNVVNSVVGDFESFTKIVKDLVGDSKFPEDVLEKYYNLCCTHNSFLHANLCPGNNGKLVAGMIIETVEIVHGIRSCKLRDTFNGKVAVWRNKLEAFEKLGMSVDVVFPRLNQLEKLSEKALIRLPYQQMYPELCNP
ncbi:hypothetical protein C5167_028980 [Papaver somniferum]|uniref:B3 domain-containing protein Os01g0234100-like n=1 Tax=Papaver somniferum TaxID=3469 RepID=UPI000E6FB99B|nr:B3 domain-containing protein Os01g0234100-like [Papaver somniferum]RZC89918.1 hypothetical protein C5167_028980 [Papaver somniferum]